MEGNVAPGLERQGSSEEAPVVQHYGSPEEHGSPEEENGSSEYAGFGRFYQEAPSEQQQQQQQQHQQYQHYQQQQDQRSTSPRGGSSNPSCNLIVNYLPSSVSEEALRGLFTPYGEVTSCKLMKDKQTGTSIKWPSQLSFFPHKSVQSLNRDALHSPGQSLGYGFIEYQDPQSARQSIEGLNGTHFPSPIKLCFIFVRLTSLFTIYVYFLFICTYTWPLIRFRFTFAL
jgi:RNA recognition motif-containing protein